jgi:YD repeat-containing protein
VQPLDLDRAPSDEALIAAGQLGGPLYPVEAAEQAPAPPLGTFVAVTRLFETDAARAERIAGRRAEQNRSFGAAIQDWNAHDWDAATERFEQHLADYPDSPWAAEAEIHLACEARYQGRYTEAEQRYRSILERLKDADDFGASKLANKARLRLGVLKTLRNNREDAAEYFSDLEANGLDWRERTYASHWVRRLAAQRGQELALLNCGYLALGELLELRGAVDGAAEVRARAGASAEGQSLAELTELAAGFGLSLSARRLSIAELDAAPLPAIIHIQGDADGDQGHYWLLQGKRGPLLRLFDPQSGRTFRQSEEEFAGEWQGVALLFAEDPASLPGIELSETERAELTGGCCGAPRPEDDLGDPNNNPEDDTGEEPPKDPCDEGECFWRVNPLSMNLFVTDQPLWYDPPIGPKVGIKLSYNSQSALAQHEPFGNKWQFNYGSYLVVDPGDTVTVFMPDGRRDLYNGDTDGNYTPPDGVYNQLSNLGDQRWELRFPDGSAFIYDIPAGTTSMQPFLVEAQDRHGQTLSFGYNAAVQLTTITDAVGQVTTLAYNDADLVESVTDPFGRTASFAYDAAGNLTQITDMAGYWSRLTYDADVYLTSIEKADGTWQFWVEPATTTAANSDNYPPPGDTMWANYRITITDPQGGQEEWFYYGGCESGYADGGTETFTWSDQRPFQLVQETARGGRVNRYGYDPEKRLTQSIAPDGGLTRQQYDADGNLTALIDANSNPTTYSYDADGLATAETYADGNGTSYTYDASGRVHTRTNARGIQTVYSYDLNGNLTGIDYSDDTPDVTFIYDEHSRLIQRNDGIGTTRFTYDANDNLLTVDGPWADDTITYTYDALDRRASMDVQGGTPVSYSYDALGRLATITQGTRTYTLTYQGNSNLIDRLTRPNGSYTTYTNDALQRLTALGNYKSDDSVINRFEYSYGTDDQRTQETVTNGLPMVALNPGLEEMQVNELNQVTSADNPARTYQYDADGNMTQGYTPAGYVWTASFDGEDRLAGIEYTDAGGILHRTEFAYLGNDLVGRIRKYEAGVLTTETRQVRDGLLALQDRDGSNAVESEYLWRDSGLGGIGRLLQLKTDVGYFDYLGDGQSKCCRVDRQRADGCCELSLWIVWPIRTCGRPIPLVRTSIFIARRIVKLRREA